MAQNCRFRNCTHTHEPGCAVLAAVESGELDSRRLESYQKLGHETSYDGLSSKKDYLKSVLKENYAAANLLVKEYTRTFPEGISDEEYLSMVRQ